MSEVIDGMAVACPSAVGFTLVRAPPSTSANRKWRAIRDNLQARLPETSGNSLPLNQSSRNFERSLKFE
jgi:hypothetical protein